MLNHLWNVTYLHFLLSRVRADINESLVLHNPFIYIGSFDRPNIFYGVKLIKPGTSKLQAILEMLRDVPRRVESRESTIMYCFTIKDTEQASVTICSTCLLSYDKTFVKLLWPNTLLMSQFEIRYMKLFLDYVLMLQYTMARWVVLQELRHTSWLKNTLPNKTFLFVLSMFILFTCSK